MAKVIKGKMYQVTSSNLDSMGLFDRKEEGDLSVRIRFVRGGEYEYWPCTEKEFAKAFDGIIPLKDWFASFKIGKEYKRL